MHVIILGATKQTMHLNILKVTGSLLALHAPHQKPFAVDETPFRPVVMWHGLGDQWNSTGLHKVAEIFDSYYPGIDVYLISLDHDPLDDQQKSMFGDANLQLDQVCNDIMDIPDLAQGFDAIGFSQGGLFLRALVERCEVKVNNLVTFGLPHMGVSELPLCDDDDWFCKRRNQVMKRQVWRDSVQKRVIPAQYFRDHKYYDRYLEHLNFLADINNERAEVNASYVSRLAAIEKLVLVSFLQDTTVVPKDSSRFADQDMFGNFVPMTETRVYREDLIGIKQLDQAGKIEFLEVDDDHMRIPETMIHQVAKNYVGSGASK